MKKTDGGSAFPRVEREGLADYAVGGMSLRDYFAGQALNGIIGNCSGDPSLWGHIVQSAYVFADAMLAEREKGQ